MTANFARLGRMRILSGSQVDDRIKVMFGQVYKSIRHPLTRTLAVQMVLAAGCPGQNQGPYDKKKIDECQVQAIYDACKSNGVYMGDIRDLDTYQTVQRTTELGMTPSPILAAVVPQFRSQIKQMYEADLRGLLGTDPNPQQTAQFVFDCDDGTILMDALLISIGFRAGAKTISEDGRVFGHVYPVVELPRYVAGPRSIVPLDLTEYEAYPGWEPPKSQRRAERIFWYTEH